MTKRTSAKYKIDRRMGENIWGLTVWEAAELAVDAVARLTIDLEIPTLPEMGIPEEDIPMLAQLAYDDPQTIGNPRGDIAHTHHEKAV